jgi:hypothetical protein
MVFEMTVDRIRSHTRVWVVLTIAELSNLRSCIAS